MSKFLPWLINLTANNMCLFLIWLCVASVWTIGSFLCSSFCQKTLDKFLPWTTGTLFVTVWQPEQPFPRTFQHSPLGAISRLFSSSLTMLMFLVEWTCSSSCLSTWTWPLLLSHPGATRSLGLVIFQIQISSEGRTVTHQSTSPQLGGGQHPPKISPQRDTAMGATGTNQLQLSPRASL